MDERVFLIFIVSLLNIGFGGFVLAHGRRSKMEIWFSVFALCVGTWSFSVLFFTAASSLAILALSAWAAFFFGNLIFLSLLWFSVYFLEKSKATAKKVAVLSVLDLVMLIYISFPGNLFVDVTANAGINKIIFSPHGLRFYVLAIAFIFFTGEVLLFTKYKISSALERVQLRFIIGGTFIAGVFGLISNLLLPAAGNFSLFWAGPLFSTIMLLPIFYSVVRYGFLNLRVIMAEIFTALLLIVSVINIFAAKTPGEIFAQSAAFIFVIAFGSLLIRSVIREARSREKIEQLAKNLEEANAELKKLDEAKSEFISLAGHQLRAPLTVIKGYTSMLQEGSFGELNKKAAEALGRVFLSANNLTKLVSELLDLSRIEAGTIKYDFKKIYFDDVIEDVIKELAEVAKARRMEIQFKNENRKTFTVSGDAYKLHEVVINLLDNSLKYSKLSPIVVTLRPRSQRLVFSVADKGFGIPEDEIQKLFQKFGRTEIAKKERPDGMGLGLYFIKKIVDDHKGRIWAESEGIGKGSTFYVELPII